ncbi:hypothetical protein MBANPS3_001554 [Mucor bainieri]
MSTRSSSSNSINHTKELAPLIPSVAPIQFLRQSSSMLDLPIRTTATAVLYYHRFNEFMNSKEKVINVDGTLTEEDALYQNEEVEQHNTSSSIIRNTKPSVAANHDLLAISLQSNRST